MRRIIRGAALVTVCSITMAGCAADRPPPPDPSTARLTAAMLSPRDLPSDFLPAQDQQVFGRLKPKDPDCRRLLALADLRGLRGLRGLRDVPATGSPAPPQAHAVFYRTDPGSTLAEHLLALSPVRALGHINDTRKAAAGCPRLKVGHRHGRLRLHRVQLELPGFEGNAYGVRYTGQVGPRYSVHFDLVMAQQGARLLVVEQPALIDRRRHHEGDYTPRIAAKALRKLRGPASPRPRKPHDRPTAGRPSAHPPT